MTIASEITKLNTNLTNAYTAVDGKGGTLPQAQNFDNLATAISSIPSGGSTPVIESLSVTPTTSSQIITASGGVDGYSPITVNAVDNTIDSNIIAGNIKSGVNILGVTGSYEGSGGGSTKYGANVDTFLGDVNANGVLQQTTEQSDLVFTGVKDVADYGLYYKFLYSNVKSVSFPDLEQVSGSYGCNNAFQRCLLLTSVSLPKLTTISGGNACTYMFAYCRNLTDVYFNSLTTSSFGSRTNQFNYMMNGTGNTTTHTLHFPSNLKSTISGLSGYPLFGGTSGYVVCAFDLPATN